MTSNVLLS